MAPNKQLQMLVGMLSFSNSYASNKNYYGTPYCTNISEHLYNDLY